MAVDKRNTPLWVKATIVLVSVSFVGAAFYGVVSAGFGGSDDQDATASGSGSGIDATWRPQVQNVAASIQADPANAGLYVQQGNNYFDWAEALVDEALATGVDPTTDLTSLYLAAAAHYAKALELSPGNPAVATDRAITLFYAGWTADAIAAIEPVLEASPEFVPAWANAGIFYENSGRTAEAIAAYQTALSLEPNGANAPMAQAGLQRLGGSTTATATP